MTPESRSLGSRDDFGDMDSETRRVCCLQVGNAFNSPTAYLPPYPLRPLQVSLQALLACRKALRMENDKALFVMLRCS